MTPRLTFRTSHADPETVAAAIRPDNTRQMTTTVEDGRVETTIERPDLSSLRATADDYLRSLAVVDAAASARKPDGTDRHDGLHDEREDAP